MGGIINHVGIRVGDLAASHKPGRDCVTTGAHIAFTAPVAGGVERWHAAAVRLGGTDNGLPGAARVQRSLHRRARAGSGRQNVEAVFHAPR